MRLDHLTQPDLDALVEEISRCRSALYRLLCAADAVIRVDLLPDLDGDREEIRAEELRALAEAGELARVEVRRWAGEGEEE